MKYSLCQCFIKKKPERISPFTERPIAHWAACLPTVSHSWTRLLMLALLHQTSRWCCLTNNSCCGLRPTQSDRQQLPGNCLLGEHAEIRFRPPRWDFGCTDLCAFVWSAQFVRSSRRASIYGTVRGFLDTIPDITPIKVRFSPPSFPQWLPHCWVGAAVTHPPAISPSSSATHRKGMHSKTRWWK